MKKRKPILLLAVINVVVFSGISYYVMTRNRVSPERRQVAEQWESFKIMPAEEYLKIAAINDSIRSTHSISDSDLDWCLEEMRRASGSSNLVTTSLRKFQITDEWRHLVNTTPEQREKIFQMACQHLPHAGSRYLTTSDKLISLELAVISRDKRAAPFIMPLLQDHDPDICRIARRNLTRLGFKA
jgi:hypothetical protein